VSAQHIANLIDNGKIVSFCLSTDKGKYVCEISSKEKGKEERFVFGDTIEEILNKLERKDIQKDQQ